MDYIYEWANGAYVVVRVCLIDPNRLIMGEEDYLALIAQFGEPDLCELLFMD